MGPLVDPGANQPDVFLGERVALAFGRHVIVLISDSGDGVHQSALGAVLWDDIGSVFPAFEGGFEGIEAQFAFLLFRTVTFETALFENRADVAFKLQAGFGGGWRKF